MRHVHLSDDEFNELVKRKFAELERKHGRVPTIPELAAALGVDSRILARKLQKALAVIGTDIQTEGTSAFKSTLRELLSGGLLLNGMPGFVELNMLLDQARRDQRDYSKLSWKIGREEFQIRVSCNSEKGDLWMMFGPKGTLFARITYEIGDILSLLDSISNNEFVNSELITHLDGEPVPFESQVINLPYQDPIPEDQLPPNVRPFRKPYQHSED